MFWGVAGALDVEPRGRAPWRLWSCSEECRKRLRGPCCPRELRSYAICQQLPQLGNCRADSVQVHGGRSCARAVYLLGLAFSSEQFSVCCWGPTCVLCPLVTDGPMEGGSLPVWKAAQWIWPACHPELTLGSRSCPLLSTAL